MRSVTEWPNVSAEEGGEDELLTSVQFSAETHVLDLSTESTDHVDYRAARSRRCERNDLRDRVKSKACCKRCGDIIVRGATVSPALRKRSHSSVKRQVISRPKKRLRRTLSGKSSSTSLYTDSEQSEIERADKALAELFEDTESDVIRGETEKAVTTAVGNVLHDVCQMLHNVSPVSSDSTPTIPRLSLCRSPYKDGTSGMFFGLGKPGIEIGVYVARISKYLRVSKSVFIVALVYLDRVQIRDRALALNEYNIHRLLITALCLASKYLEDEVHKNSHFARVGGVPTLEEMNRLETEFLRRLRWNCTVGLRTYYLYFERVLGKKTRVKRRYSPTVVLSTAKR